MRFRSRGAMAAMLLAAAPLGSAAPAMPQAGIDAIFSYAGTWKASVDKVATRYGKAGHATNTLRNDCWKSGSYLACRQIVNGDQKVLLVFTCRQDGHTCSTYQVPSNGSPPESGVLMLDGKTWIFPWSVAKNGSTTYFRVLNTWSSPRTIEFCQEFSSDRIHWTTMATGHETKIAQGDAAMRAARAGATG